MSPTVKAVARVIHEMKPPHYATLEFRAWQEWAHRLSKAVCEAEALAPATMIEFMTVSGTSG